MTSTGTQISLPPPLRNDASCLQLVLLPGGPPTGHRTSFCSFFCNFSVSPLTPTFPSEWKWLSICFLKTLLTIFVSVLFLSPLYSKHLGMKWYMITATESSCSFVFQHLWILLQFSTFHEIVFIVAGRQPGPDIWMTLTLLFLITYERKSVNCP